ncbi:uncharacterized protein C8R40DRAFT_1178451 [Lentinula edodes]|uniref:uncharacterized protein n=1 Tax=Lentinula edodes TaxID=5353 RepID=UPI001E8E0FE2|nr:uncharacterized protein C8R40DRAFT_1178451 [Lentinula edodes]KAH7867915.1 hypothetical protein C8R40DRAFT_1178451 [Lentinula edodes]
MSRPVFTFSDSPFQPPQLPINALPNTPNTGTVRFNTASPYVLPQPPISNPGSRLQTYSDSSLDHHGTSEMQTPGVEHGTWEDECDELNEDNTSYSAAIGPDENNSNISLTPQKRSEGETTDLMSWVDGIQSHYSLTPMQVRELKGMVAIAGWVETGQLKINCLQYAATCRIENKFEAQHTDSTSVKEVVNGALKQINKGYEVPRHVKAIIRSIARDECAKPTRLSYGDIIPAVWERCKTEAGQHEFTDILAKTGSATALKKEAESLTGKMLQQFRDDASFCDIFATIIDETGKRGLSTLEQATVALVQKYVQGGLGSSNGHLYQFRFAILRRFLRERCCEEDGPILKKQKNLAGKQAKEASFWGRVDAFLDGLKCEFKSNDLRTDKWTAYLVETIQEDWKRFGNPSRALPPLPLSIDSLESHSPSRNGEPPSPENSTSSLQSNFREPLQTLANEVSKRKRGAIEKNDYLAF